MAAPTLSDYEYQFKDTGFKLNGSSALPFIDVMKVTGLDLPVIDANIDDIDGQHGSSIYAKYTRERTIVVEGTLYANASTIETTIDTLITNFIPDGLDYPFYFKHPGATQRYVMAQPVAFKCDVETLRRTGSALIQIQLIASDPRKYVDNSNQLMGNNVNYTPANAGNVNSYAIFTVVGAYATITFHNNTLSRTVVITYAAVGGDITVLDMKKRLVTVNGINRSSSITTALWWDIPAGGGHSVKYTATGSVPTSVTMATKQAWL